jgi:hypothetical protein
MKTSLLGLLCLATAACTAAATDRVRLLETIRSAARVQAGQAVALQLDRLNIEQDWALAVGTLEPVDGGELDWSRARDPLCHQDLDKSLWVIARQADGRWQIDTLWICASEPPYWYLQDEQATAFSRPCGLYAGLQVAADMTAEDQCRAYQAMR